MKHLLLIGPPAAGKGTFAGACKEYTQISTGDLLRAEKKSGSELGDKIAKLIDEGKFVDDETMFDILKNNLPKNESLIFDGYPRNKTQISFFEDLIDNKDDITVIHFDVDLSILEDRVVNRLTCKDCGKIHNLKSIKPKEDGSCSSCGGKLDKRKDDNADAFKVRLDTYKNETYPIIDHFKNYKNYIKVDANQEYEKVLSDIKKAME